MASPRKKLSKAAIGHTKGADMNDVWQRNYFADGGAVPATSTAVVHRDEVVFPARPTLRFLLKFWWKAGRRL